MSKIKFIDYWVEHKYLFLLASFGALFLFSPSYFATPVGGWLLNLFFVTSFMFIGFALHKNSVVSWGLCILGVLTSLSYLFDLVLATSLLNFPHKILMFVVYFYIIGIVLWDVTHKEVIVKDIVMGALSVYILIALAFGNLYIQLDEFNSNAFNLSEVIINSEFERVFNLTYFSFTTLTTVGFGDIVPNTIQAKSFVVLEQVTGIFYLAVLVSRLVGRLSRN